MMGKKTIRTRKIYSQKDLKFLIEKYPNTSSKDLSNLLGVTVSAITNKAQRLGLKKSETFENSGRFKKGNVPFNKGKKITEFMSKEGIERSKATRFKKGDMPHNTKYDGHQRTDIHGYTRTRVCIGNYRLNHHLIWEKTHGNIPQGYNVSFKDGNHQNLSIENLELVSKTENMYRNSTHDYPREIIPSLVLNKKIEQELKKIKNG